MAEWTCKPAAAAGRPGQWVGVHRSPGSGSLVTRQGRTGGGGRADCSPWANGTRRGIAVKPLRWVGLQKQKKRPPVSLQGSMSCQMLVWFLSERRMGRGRAGRREAADGGRTHKVLGSGLGLKTHVCLSCLMLSVPGRDSRDSFPSGRKAWVGDRMGDGGV